MDTTNSDKPECQKCGRRSNMVLHGDEWVCHSTHPLSSADPMHAMSPQNDQVELPPNEQLENQQGRCGG